MNFGLFCKSFAPDLDRFERLFASFLAHAAEDLPFVLSVPSADKALFQDRLRHPRLELLTDEEISGQPRPGWTGQQQVKMDFGCSGHLDSFLIVDSDFTFIREFSRGDFFRGDDLVFYVATHDHTWEQNAPQIRAHLAEEEPPVCPPSPRPGAIRLGSGYSRLWDLLRPPGHYALRQRISGWFREDTRKLGYLPGPVWSAESLKALRDWLQAEQRMDFAQLLKMSPWEADWVGEWELYRGAPGRFLAAPRFVHFATEAGAKAALAEGVTPAQLGRRYLGVALAARHYALEELA